MQTSLGIITLIVITEEKEKKKESIEK